MRRYWKRGCSGLVWRRNFPSAETNEIRKFLNVFVGAFGFAPKRMLCFRPDDKVMDVYRALYPHPGEPDGMELEGFVEGVEKEYEFNLQPVWQEDITLGDIFELSRKAAA